MIIYQHKNWYVLLQKSKFTLLSLFGERVGLPPHTSYEGYGHMALPVFCEFLRVF